MSDTIYWIWLAQRLGPGSRHLPDLLEKFADPYEIFRADADILEHMQLGERVTARLLDKNLNEAYEICDFCASHRIGILTYGSDRYPSRLRPLKDPPAVLYFKGKFPNLNENLSIGIVGTRKMSEYGKKTAYKIAYELAAAGTVITSGMALGIDSVAACAAIAASGQTIAVLGSGVDVIYPKEHTVLYHKIIENGAVISEYPPTTGVSANHFPERNRIISGLSNGVLVVECDVKSGAMITARSALDQGRDLFAIPGNLGSKGANGTNQLLHSGANLVLTTEDILKNYEFYYGSRISYLNLSRAKEHSLADEQVLSEMGVCSRHAYEEDSVSCDAPMARENKFRPKKAENTLPHAVSDTENAHAEKRDGTFMHRKDTSEGFDELEEAEKKLLLAMPDDRAVGIDELIRQGFPCSDAMGTLALLEIKGFVSSLPGGLYIKN